MQEWFYIVILPKLGEKMKRSKENITIGTASCLCCFQLWETEHNTEKNGSQKQYLEIYFRNILILK